MLEGSKHYHAVTSKNPFLDVLEVSLLAIQQTLCHIANCLRIELLTDALWKCGTASGSLRLAKQYSCSARPLLKACTHATEDEIKDAHLQDLYAGLELSARVVAQNRKICFC